MLLVVRDANKEDADALFNIATCERELKNFQSAERYFKIYTDKFPNHPHGWASSAECQLQLQSFEPGVRFADRAIKLDASSLAAWTVRGNCQRAMGKFEDALASYRRANQIQPNVECWLNAGLTLLEIDRVSEAIDALSHAIALAPNVASLRVTRGGMFHNRGKLQEAVADYRAALTLNPGDGDTLKKACLCLLGLHQGQQAIELCQGISRAQPDGVDGRARAGMGAERARSDVARADDERARAKPRPITRHSNRSSLRRSWFSRSAPDQAFWR